MYVKIHNRNLYYGDCFDFYIIIIILKKVNTSFLMMSDLDFLLDT